MVAVALLQHARFALQLFPQVIAPWRQRAECVCGGMAEDGVIDPAVAQLRAWASDKGLLALPSSKPALGDGDAEAAGSGDGLFDGGGESDEQTQKAGKEQGETEAFVEHKERCKQRPHGGVP